MLRKATAILLMAVFLLGSSPNLALADPGIGDVLIKKGENSDNVILLQLRLRDLGYYNYKITGFFGDFTKDSLVAFQKANKLSADGVAGAKTLELMYSNAAQRKPVVARITPKPVKAKSVKYGALKDWFDYVNNRWSRSSGQRVLVQDYNTGKKFYVIRTGGSNHADVEPAKASDSATIKSFNNGWSWSRRAVIVTIGGVAIAASMHCMPHAYDKVAGNGMEGHVCIHFLNSKTHINNMRDPDHQRMVKRAAGR